MGNIVFGYENHLFRPGTVFSAGSEAVGHEAEKLGDPNPASYWRATALTGIAPWVQATFDDILPWNLIAPLYVTASPHQNLVNQGFSLGAAWTSNNASVNPGVGVIPTTEIPIRVLFATGSGSLEHSLDQTYGRNATSAWTVTTSVYVNTANVGNSANAGFQIDDGGATNFALVTINLSTGAVNTQTDGGFLSITSATSTLVSGTWYRVEFTCTAAAFVGDLRARLLPLDSSYSSTYSQANESFELGGVTVELGDTAGAAIDSRTGQASFWSVSLLYDSDDLMPLPDRRDRETWHAARGWLHALKSYQTVQYGSGVRTYYLDENNPSGNLEISNKFVGMGWQPEANIELGFSITINPDTGGRVLAGEIKYASEADALGDGIPMALLSGVGAKRSTIASGGQEFRDDGRKPILVILDPDESEYGQEITLYGWLDEFSLESRPRDTWGLRFTVSEVMK